MVLVSFFFVGGLGVIVFRYIEVKFVFVVVWFLDLGDGVIFEII